jgi:opine dehydrogenase
VYGVVTGFARLASFTADIRQPFKAAKLVFVVIPASGHRSLASLCAPHLTPEHTVVLIPGRTGGALEFANTIEALAGWRPTVAETQTFPLVSRVVQPGTVQIAGIKKALPIAAFPGTETESVFGLVSGVLPRLQIAEDILETGLSNIGSVFHPAPLILNAGRAESTEGGYNHYLDGITPSVARFIGQIDAERVAIAEALGKRVLTAVEWLRAVYDVSGRDLYECLQHNPAYQGLGAPQSLDHRYLFEDVPTGLVPLAEIGEAVAVSAPTIRTTIAAASHLTGRNFWHEGRTAEAMGITGMSAEELQTYIWEGSIEPVEEEIPPETETSWRTEEE